MNYLQKLLSFLLLSCFGNSLAIIVKMEELFCPALKQTVILGADFHINGLTQKEDILNFIKNHKAYMINEGPISKVSEALREVLLLEALNYELNTNELSHFNAEFRYSNGRLSAVIMSDMESGYKACKKLYESKDAKIFLGTLIFDSRHELIEMLQDVSRDLSILKKEQYFSPETIEILAVELDEIGEEYNKINQMIESLLVDKDLEYNSAAIIVADYVIDNAYAEGKDDQIFHKLDGLDEKFFSVSNQLFDIRVITQLLKRRCESVVLVHAGKVHTDNVARILQKIGYVSESKKEVDLHSKVDFAFKSFFTKDRSELTVLNVNEFIAACKTLQK